MRWRLAFDDRSETLVFFIEIRRVTDKFFKWVEVVMNESASCEWYAENRE